VASIVFCWRSVVELRLSSNHVLPVASGCHTNTIRATSASVIYTRILLFVVIRVVANKEFSRNFPAVSVPFILHVGSWRGKM